MSYNLKGYHGTIRKFADTILSSKRFKKSSDNNEWLGTGIYFYGHREEAVWWAKVQAKRYRECGAILSCDVECDSSEIFDMDLFDNIMKVNREFRRFLRDLKDEEKLGIDFLTGQEDKRHCLAVELYKEKHPEIKLVAYTFDAPGVRQKEDPFVPRQKQYCVTDDKVIKKIYDEGDIA